MSGVGLDYGAHLQGMAAEQYKMINTTAPQSKARGENIKPCTAGKRNECRHIKKQQSKSLI